MTEAAAPVPAPTLAQKLSAEAIGTFVLILFGVGAAVVADDYAAVGLSFGIAIIVMVYAFGRISGGHFNPAVSLGAALGGRISWKEAGAYMGAQLVGAIVGALVLVLILIAGDTGFEIGDDALGANGFGDRGGLELGGALIIEIVMTFIFVLVILAVTDTRNEHPALAPLAIGLALAAIHFASMGATGTSVNPARSIGPALFAGGDAISQVWLFIVAPLIGAAIAGFAYPALYGHGSDPVPGSGLNFGSGASAAVPGYGAPDQYQQQWNQQVPGYPQGQQAAPADQYQQQWNQQAAPTAAQPVQQAQPPVQETQQVPVQAAPAAPVEQPIIQDGWQWDPQAQQWIPAQQQPPAPGGEQTQVRPPGQ
jgi:aquaporin Z